MTSAMPPRTSVSPPAQTQNAVEKSSTFPNLSSGAVPTTSAATAANPVTIPRDVARIRSTAALSSSGGDPAESLLAGASPGLSAAAALVASPAAVLPARSAPSMVRMRDTSDITCATVSRRRDAAQLAPALVPPTALLLGTNSSRQLHARRLRRC
jgi:hypothetical protein